MKVKEKLALTALAGLLVPMIIIFIIASDSMKDALLNGEIKNIDASTKAQAENLNYYVEDIISSANYVADLARDFTAESNRSGYNPGEDNENYADAVNMLGSLNKYGSSLEKAMIINNSGIIAASTNYGDVGSSFPDYEGVFELSLENNGISPFYVYQDDVSEKPAFMAAKSIYSEDGVCEGVLCQIYNLSYVQKLLNNSRLDSYTTMAVLDGAGNIMMSPYSSVRDYTFYTVDNTAFSGGGEAIKRLLESETASAKTMVEEIGDSRRERRIFTGAYASNGDWIVISSTSKSSAQMSLNTYSNGLSLKILLFDILSVASVIFVIFFFVNPMDDLLRGIKRKQNGDLKYEISVKSKDEFGQMAVLFESVFEKMLESDHRYETIVDMTDNIIFEVNYKKNTVFTSKNFNKKFSLRPKDDTIKESFLYKTHVHKDDKQRYEQDLEGILGPSNTLQGEYRVKNVYGDFGWIVLKANKFFDRNDRPTKVVGVIVDIDREKKSKMSLLQRASFDNLTQLFNREAFLKALQNELEVSGMKKNLSAIMFIDLDDFKFFNDEFGHACGDEVLKFVADTLKEISFERGFAGRFGGDEFVVCLTNLTLYGDTGKSAQEIIDVLGKGFTSESTGERLEVHCSIGIAFLRENGKTCEDVIAAADEAMYNIKKHGKSAFAFAKARESGEKSASYDETIASIASIDSDGPAEGKESEEQEAVVMEDMLL